MYALAQIWITKDICGNTERCMAALGFLVLDRGTRIMKETLLVSRENFLGIL